MLVKLQTLRAPEGAQAFLKELLTVQVRFMVVGGLGLQYYCPQRLAPDLDILIEANETNAIGVVEALVRVGFNIEPETVRLLFTPRRIPQQISLHPSIPAAILTEGDGFDFMAHWELGTWADMLWCQVRVASPQLLVAMATRQTHPGNSEDVDLLLDYLAGTTEQS